MAESSKNPYQKLAALSKKIHLLTGIELLMGWDQETYMPKGTAKNRADASELLAGLLHQERTSSAFAKALAELVDLDSGEIKDPSLSDKQRASVREFRRDYLKQIK